MNSVLDKHEVIRATLLGRSRIRALYLSLLEETLGFGLENTLISTAEHTDPFNRAIAPTFLLPQLILNQRTDNPTPILILATSVVSTGNKGYPRGFFLPEPLLGSKRFNLLRDRDRGKSLPGIPPKRMEDFRTSPALTRAFFDKYGWLAPHFAGTNHHASYAEQMGAVMISMADAWMGNRPHGMRVAIQEDVARRILIRLIEADDPFTHALLFDRRNRSTLRERFREVPHAGIGGPGTFLFWGRSEKGRDVRLDETDGHLAGQEFRIALHPSGILQALKDQTLWPGLFLSLFCVSWLPGLTVVGGVRQALYWPLMADALNGILGGDGRGEAFNVWAYANYKLGGVRVSNGAAIETPETGTGLHLADLVAGGETITDALALPYPDPQNLARLKRTLPHRAT